ncbi:MAG TPA: GldG family protein, partial [Polyangiaceae bacterium]
MASKGRSIGLVVVLVAIGAVLVGATVLAFHLLRDDKLRLCPGTPKLLASLHGPVVVDAYVTRGAPKLDHFVGELDALLHEYERQSQGHFHYRILEARDEDTRKRAKELGLTEQPYAESDDGGASLVQGFMGLAFEYGGERDTIKYLPPESTQGLEFWIDNKLRELRAKAEGRSYHFGVLGMHGEIALSEPNLMPRAGGTPNLQGIITQNFPFYAFHDIDLMGGTGDVDPSIDALIVTQPAKDLTDAELTRIDEFVMR